MVQAGKFVRFWLGIQAWLILALPVLPLVIALQVNHPEALPTKISFTRLAFDSFLGIVSLIAWWALRQGWPSARPWALAACALSIFHGRLAIAAGLLGIAAYWKPEVVQACSAKPQPGAAEPKRLAGDGTHKALEQIIPFLSFAFYIAASLWWANWGEDHGLPISKNSRWPNFLAAMYASIFFHELGHFLAGLGSGMTLRAFQLGPVAGQIRNGKWRLAVNPVGFLGGGSVGMVPLHLKNIRGRMVLMILGGPVASLLVGSIAALLTLTAPHSPWESAWRFFALLGTFCLSDFVVNLTPLRPESHYSDGAQIYQLMSSGPWADRHVATAMVGSSLVTPLRPRDFDRTVLERAAASIHWGMEGLHLGLFLAMHHFDSGRFDEGIAVMRNALEQDPKAAGGLEADSMAEIVFYEGALANDPVRARDWWRKVEAKGNSKKNLDYWKGRAALLLSEKRFDESRAALKQSSEFAGTRPNAGAYDYDRWCLSVIREKLGSSDLANLHEATLKLPVLTAPHS